MFMRSSCLYRLVDHLTMEEFFKRYEGRIKKFGGIIKIVSERELIISFPSSNNEGSFLYDFNCLQKAERCF